MIRRGLVVIALVSCGLVSASFVMFARDQVDTASIHQQREINGGGRAIQGAPPVAVHHSQPRAFIDDAARTLTSPFRGIVQSSASQWLLHIVPTLLALLVYGVGIGFLARYSSGMTRTRPGGTRATSY